MREIVLINVTGEERPGLTAAITGVLAQAGVNILDIAQAAVHGATSLGILIEVADGASLPVLSRNVLATAQELDQQARFTQVDAADYRRWVEGQGSQRHILTLLSRQLTAEQVQRVSALSAVQGLSIERIERLSLPVAPGAQPGNACIEFSLRGQPGDAAALRAEFRRLPWPARKAGPARLQPG